MKSTTFHASLQLIFLPWTIQISSSPAHSKRLLEGDMMSPLIIIIVNDSSIASNMYCSTISARILLDSTRATLLSLSLASTELFMVSMYLIPNSTLYPLVLTRAYTSLTLRRNLGWLLSMKKLKNFFTAPLRTTSTCKFLSLLLST